MRNIISKQCGKACHINVFNIRQIILNRTYHMGVTFVPLNDS